jgi:hypothetical protein
MVNSPDMETLLMHYCQHDKIMKAKGFSLYTI